MFRKLPLKALALLVLPLAVGVALAAGMKVRNQGTGSYTPPPSLTPGAFSVTCPNALCTFTGSVPPGTTKVRIDGSGPGTVSFDAPVAGGGSTFSFTAPTAVTPSGSWNFSFAVLNETSGTQQTVALGNPVPAWQSPATPGAPSATCVVGTCTVTGTVPAGAQTIRITGTGPGGATSSADAVVTGSNYSAAVTTAASGGWTFTATASNPGPVSSTSTASASVNSPAAAAAALTGGQSVDATQLSAAGLSAAYLADLNTNNTCGATGTQNCLAVFNASKASSGCTLAGGASATASQITDYVGCVMRASHVAVASAYVPPATQTASGGNTCQAALYGSLPQGCGSPQWSCSISGTNWSLDSSGGGLRAKWTPPSGNNGSPLVSGSYNVTVSLNIYTPAYQQTTTFGGVSADGGTQAQSVSVYGQVTSTNANRFALCTNGTTLANSAQFRTAFCRQSGGYVSGRWCGNGMVSLPDYFATEGRYASFGENLNSGPLTWTASYACVTSTYSCP